MDLYSNIIPKCGKRGREVLRVSGTNGPVTDESTRRLLHLLRSDKKLLPRKAGAALILKDSHMYHFFYTKKKKKQKTSSDKKQTTSPNKKHKSSPIAHCWKYVPPQLDGSAALTGSDIDAFTEHYCKMITVFVLEKMNNVLSSCISPSAIAAELDSFAYARGTFDITKSYADLCKAYFACNTISLVAFPVGQHSIPRKRNAVAMGIGPVQPRNSQQLLTEFFNTNTWAARHWRAQFNAYTCRGVC